MKWTKDKLRAVKIFNPHNLCKAAGTKLYVDYNPADNGRGGHGASWEVVGVYEKTDPTAPWHDYGQKHFLVWGRHDKESKRQECMKWVAEKYGITEWERDPFGAYQVKGAMAQIDKLEVTR